MKWPQVKISQFCDTGSGGTPSRKKSERYYGGHISWVKSGELHDDVLKETEEHITEAAIEESSAKIVPAGAVLVAMYGATVGKTALLGIEAATNQAICNIIPRNGLAEPVYVWYGVRSKLNELLRRRVGGAQPNISQKIIRNTKLLLPPLTEQRRIVELLDQADALRQQRRAADALAERVLPALFYQMFGDPRSNPKGLKKKPLKKLLKVKSGSFLPARSMDSEGPYPVYGGNGINGYHSEYLFEKPVIVIGRVGVYCGVVHRTPSHSWVTDNALYVSEMSNEVDERYLELALSIANLNQYSSKAAQPLISGKRIYPVEILVPDLDAQETFVNRVAALDKLAAQADKSRKELDDLFTLMLQRAFSGELTAAWREAHMEELLQEMEAQAKYLEEA